MQVLLAGPGTGKTTKIRSILDEKPDVSRVLVLSFTNATVEDLKKELGGKGVSEHNCMTLHKFAVKYNHDKFRHVLNRLEEDKLAYIATGVGVAFDQLCDFLSCTTFDQMIERFVTYASHNPTYLKEKLSDFSTIIIDEYQDFNPREQSLIDLLVEQVDDTYVLGDDDQCIYDFKDASSDRIIELHGTHPSLDHEHICYRCPDCVVEPATKLIKNNTKRVDKKWEKSGKAGSLFYKQFTTFSEVADYVVAEIQKILAASETEKILVLSPVEFAASDVASKFEAEGIEYENCFSESIPKALIERAWELRSLFGNYKYLNLLLTGYRIITPRKKLYELVKKHIERGQDLQELKEFLIRKLPEEMTVAYTSVDEALARPEFAELASMYAATEGETENEKLENIFVQTEEAPAGRIRLMSIHKSKGLGAEHVFMVGLTEGIIPNRKKGTDTMESQRRVFYVGMTRAKKHLHLISSIKIPGRYARTVNFADFRFDVRTRMMNGRASSFIEELGL